MRCMVKPTTRMPIDSGVSEKCINSLEMRLLSRHLRSKSFARKCDPQLTGWSILVYNEAAINIKRRIIFSSPKKISAL
jgi:hypothetical protein